MKDIAPGVPYMTSRYLSDAVIFLDTSTKYQHGRGGTYQPKDGSTSASGYLCLRLGNTTTMEHMVWFAHAPGTLADVIAGTYPQTDCHVVLVQPQQIVATVAQHTTDELAKYQEIDAKLNRQQTRLQTSRTLADQVNKIAAGHGIELGAMAGIELVLVKPQLLFDLLTVMNEKIGKS